MSTDMNATISPDRAAGGPHLFPDTVPSSSRAKRRHEEANTQHDGTGTGPAAKVACLANANEEAKAQDGDETPETSLTTEKIMDLLKDLWSNDECVIEKALGEIADIAVSVASADENEEKIRVLGVHTAVFQVLQKHFGCLGIQKEGMRALGKFSSLVPTKKLLVDIGYVEVILARMEMYADSERIQNYGCSGIEDLVIAKHDAERLEKSGGIAVVIAAMKAHPNSQMVQIRGCIVLSHMTQWEEYRPLIVKAGGASAISFVIEMCWDQPNSREYAYGTMERLFKRPH
jgi:hypothetical protein